MDLHMGEWGGAAMDSGRRGCYHDVIFVPMSAPSTSGSGLCQRLSGDRSPASLPLPRSGAASRGRLSGASIRRALLTLIYERERLKKCIYSFFPETGFEWERYQ